ncbi:hypothetical protein I315_00056 [Cryptococcus gattii Ru294]|nr:hypothetical protein I315_00056 [Cryptococcus gattii Ru294]
MYYPLGLLEWLFAEVAGDDARIGLLYDLACNFEAHLQRRGLLLSKIEQGQLKCALAIFHAFAHSWQCQLEYNPRRRNRLVESATRHETLKRDISRKARELVGLDREEELQCFRRVHEALCNLQRQVIAYRMTVEPILKTRSGAMERLDQWREQAGQLSERRVEGYDRAVEHYAKNFPSRQPPQLARSVQEVLAKKPDDPFWSDILFEAKNAAWAYERTCQLGQ